MKKLLLLIILFSASCRTSRTGMPSTPSAAALVNGKIFSTAWQQRSAEYKALCYQAFNLARVRVDELSKEKVTLPRAIMTDIDETVLNNSPYEAHQLLQGKDYDNSSWEDWTSKGMADTLPGALAFLQYAAASGIEIFYVTNRGENEREGTLSNLRSFHFPNADNDHLLLKGNSSSKDGRKKFIASGHSIVLLMGDNLNDFSSLFEKKDPDEREKVADSFAADFGKRFIVLPNPVYGDWEFSLYHYNYQLTPAQKDSVLRGSLYHY